MPEPRPMPPNEFKAGLAAGTPQLGAWLVLESLTATEMMAGSGFDWLLLDMEHSCLSPSDVVQHLRAAKGGTAELVVRVPANDAVLVKRLLDAGVRSFLYPMIQSAQEAHDAVAATRYPPAGIRGVAGNTRASNFNRSLDYLNQCAEQICVVVQVETPQAIDVIGDMGAIDGLDGIFVGPNDLAANMGLLGQPGAAAVKDKIALALDRIRAAGKAAGILNYNSAEAQGLFAAGYSFIAIGSDGSILARRSEALVDEVRSLLGRPN